MTASWEHWICDLRDPERIPRGLDALAHRFGGAMQGWRSAAEVRRGTKAVESLVGTMRDLSDDALRSRVAEIHAHFRRHPDAAEDRAAEGLAIVREAAARTLGMRPYTVQITGAFALRLGFLAEMATGEGKSLTAALAAVLAAWGGRPCHVITVNDYLAARDPEKFRPLFEYCGLSVGCVTGPMEPPERTRGHAADVTYTTSKEIVADFLRDRLALGPRQRAFQWKTRLLWQPGDVMRIGVVMRGLHTAIVDEADSVLIDEAVTPLIIAGGGASGTSEAFATAWQAAAAMEPNVDYRRNERYREIELLPPGIERAELLTERMPGPWRATVRCRELVHQAVIAREFFHRGKQYIVRDGEVIIVDDFTGRLALKRKWRHGLHQAIEAKEGVKVSPLDETLARLSFQRFYRLFPKLAGMTGTGKESGAEFWQIYRLPVLAIPTNRPCRRTEMRDRVYSTLEEKWHAVAEEVAAVHATGRPVLVGTRSVTASEALAETLRKRHHECVVLNAERESEEAEIVARAGRRGRITIATNMAGRGTDILLGEGVAELGGLHVIATERHESRRIDRQLFGRAGRQGEPGSAQAFLSMEDEVFTRFVPSYLRSSALASTVCRIAQRTAQRLAFRSRRNVLDRDTWLEESLAFAGRE
jgi:preprotein translocase subunit SecA